MNSNKFVKTVLVGTGTLLILAGGMTAVIDPFFHYHKPLKQLEYPLERGKERYLNNGIIQNFDYDAAITGTSMMQNFKTSQFDDLFGTHSVKVTLTGDPYWAIDEEIRTIFDNKSDIKYIFRCLDYNKIFDDKSDYNYNNVPTYLYDNNIWNDVQYLFNKDIFIDNTLGVIKYTLHGEKTPSFNIYTENNSFYCFGCGAGGDVITFIMKIENLDYIEAVKFLAERAGLNMPEESNYDDSMANLKKRIYEANRETARFFHRCLYSPLGKEGLDYLHSRGLTDKTIRHFGLGFAPNDHFALSNYLRKKGFKDNELISANLVYKNKSGNGTNDRFYNRVMFPIIDVRGNVIAFGGRIMTDQKPKYLNTSDTPVFSKSNNLFSLNNAKKNQDRTLILCEGYMDVIAVNQAGFQNAVATLGTALTSQQASVMKRYADDVIICYDADEAGQKATQRAIGILRRTGLNIRVLTVPDGKDPDEFIRKHGDNGGAAFYNLVNGSFNDVEYQLSKVRKKYDLKLADQRVKYVNEAINIIAKIDDDVERDVYSSKLADETGVHTESISNSLKRVRSKIKYSNRKEEFRKIRTNLSGREDNKLAT